MICQKKRKSKKKSKGSTSSQSSPNDSVSNSGRGDTWIPDDQKDTHIRGPSGIY